MSQDKSQLTEEELKKASGGGLVRVFDADNRRRFGPRNSPGQKLTPLGKHQEASPEQKQEMDPTPIP